MGDSFYDKTREKYIAHLILETKQMTNHDEPCEPKVQYNQEIFTMHYNIDYTQGRIQDLS